jgi:hypothetical protein
MRRSQIGLLFLVFLSHASFSGAISWNQSARIGATFAFVEPGPSRFTFRIDGFVDNNSRGIKTQDWSKGIDGHYYSNKAPGVSIIGVPLYALLYATELAVGADPQSSKTLARFNTIILNLWSSVLFTALATVILFSFLVAGNASARDALLGALAYAFSTLVFPYDTSIWGHTTAAACLLMSLCLVFWPGGMRRAALAGALGGLAVLVEYPAAFGLLAAGAAVLASSGPWRRRLEFAAGAAVPMLVLLLYQKAAFGGFLTTAVSQSNPILLEPSLAFGVLGSPSPVALWGLTFSAYRGLFLFCPVLLFSFVGARQLWRSGRRAPVAAGLGGFCACLLFAASLSNWWGGWCSGPRYLIIAIPLLAILFPAGARLDQRVRRLYHGAIAFSALNMLVVTAAEVAVNEAERNPLYRLAYGLVFSRAYPYHPETRSLGQTVLGLSPPWDLVAFILLFGFWVYFLLRKSAAAKEPQVATARGAG